MHELSPKKIFLLPAFKTSSILWNRILGLGLEFAFIAFFVFSIEFLIIYSKSKYAFSHFF